MNILCKICHFFYWKVLLHWCVFGCNSKRIIQECDGNWTEWSEMNIMCKIFYFVIRKCDCIGVYLVAIQSKLFKNVTAIEQFGLKFIPPALISPCLGYVAQNTQTSLWGHKLLYQTTEIDSKWFKWGACLKLTVDYFSQFFCCCRCCMRLMLICSLDCNMQQIAWQSLPAVSFIIMSISTELFNKL